MPEENGGSHRGLLVDFGGVLTTDVFASFKAFCEAEGLLADTVRDKFMKDPMARELLFDLETGALSEEDFEPKFAAVLEVSEPAGLIDRLFAGMRPDEAMVGAVRAAKAAGVRTGLISNSWGKGRYDRSLFPELFVFGLAFFLGATACEFHLQRPTQEPESRWEANHLIPGDPRSPTVDRRDFHFRSECGFGGADRDLYADVITVALEDRMFAKFDRDIQITRRTAAFRSVAAGADRAGGTPGRA